MTPYDLIFLASLLFVLILSGAAAVSALRRDFDHTLRVGWALGVFIACYAVVLISVALARPRRFYPQGERRCFDDWCIAALGANVAGSAAGAPCQTGQGWRTWVSTVEVSSAARRVRQRARDARLELEDRQGRRYEPCAGPLPNGTEGARSLSDQLGPGESFRVLLPFRLPEAARPAGVVIHHGDFPGIVIIGADQSVLHPPALMRIR